MSPMNAGGPSGLPHSDAPGGASGSKGGVTGLMLTLRYKVTLDAERFTHARTVDQRPTSRRHPSLAAAVRRGLKLEIACIEQRAKPFEIWEGRDISPIDGSRSAHTDPILLV